MGHPSKTSDPITVEQANSKINRGLGAKEITGESPRERKNPFAKVKKAMENVELGLDEKLERFAQVLADYIEENDIVFTGGKSCRVDEPSHGEGEDWEFVWEFLFELRYVRWKERRFCPKLHIFDRVNRDLAEFGLSIHPTWLSSSSFRSFRLGSVDTFESYKEAKKDHVSCGGCPTKRTKFSERDLNPPPWRSCIRDEWRWYNLYEDHALIIEEAACVSMEFLNDVIFPLIRKDYMSLVTEEAASCWYTEPVMWCRRPLACGCIVPRRMHRLWCLKRRAELLDRVSSKLKKFDELIKQEKEKESSTAHDSASTYKQERKFLKGYEHRLDDDLLAFWLTVHYVGFPF